MHSLRKYHSFLILEVTKIKREVKNGQMYRHFKGFIATIITIAEHTETKETLVIYKCESPKDMNITNSDHIDGIYARPIDMFLSEVDHEKYPNVKQKYRFELINEGECNYE